MHGFSDSKVNFYLERQFYNIVILDIITIFIVVVIILPAKLFYLHALSVKTNAARKNLETASRARFLNSNHSKNTNGFGVLALPILFVPVRPSFFLARKLPLHAEKGKQNGGIHGSSVQKRKRIL